MHQSPGVPNQSLRFRRIQFRGAGDHHEPRTVKFTKTKGEFDFTDL